MASVENLPKTVDLHVFIFAPKASTHTICFFEHKVFFKNNPHQISDSLRIFFPCHRITNMVDCFRTETI